LAPRTVASLAWPSGASAANFKTLYSFCAQGGTSCTDGANPYSGVIQDAAGNLYGTTQGGGAYGWGTVFELIPSVGPWGQVSYSEKVLHSFCSQGGGYCTDGALPILWNLIIDSAGNLYGTTIYGGANSIYLGVPAGSSGYPSTSGYAGVVFELSPNANRTNWTYRVLYSFCAQGGAGCTDGRGPQSGVIMGPDGNLYGSTSEGGAQNSNCCNGACGTIFELIPNVDKSIWTEKLLYVFCKQGGAICADGGNPHSGVRFAFGGLLGNADLGGGAYSNQAGGAPGQATGGNVFLLTPKEPGAPWTYKVLYSFCSQPNCADGSAPEQDSMVVDPSGRIYGTAALGGNNNASCVTPQGFALGCGVVFELSPNADRTAWTERVVYAFCAVGGANCTDGSLPDLGIIQDAQGNLVGTTLTGGANNQNGVVFAVNPKLGADDQSALIQTARYSAAGNPGGDHSTSGTEQVLYNFCAQPNCADSGGGGNAVTMLAPGRIYSGTFGGGAYGMGVIFELSR
jgi:uncharacterized repeat protein (TIGR03803 family)